MNSIAAPLHLLAEEAAWFARDQQVRLLHVVTDADLRGAVMKVVLAQEFHAHNRAPFVTLDDGFSPAAPSWAERAQRLRGQHAARVKAMGAEGSALPPAPGGAAPLIAFAQQVRQVADAAPKPTRGLVVVLAPTRVEDPVAWAAAVSGLVTSSRLADVRWIVVELEQPALGSLVSDLGARAMAVRTFVDEVALDRELATTLDQAASAPISAPGPALMGGAWPRGVSPPLRAGKAAPPSDPELKAAMIAAGITPAITPSEGHALRTQVLRAAQALKAKRGPDAVRLQREARDLCDALGLPALAVTMELVLGTYLVQLGQQKLALETLRAASTRAEVADMPKEAAQAQLAIGALAGVQRRPDLSALAYARAAELALRADIPLLAIEAYRLAGTQCADLTLKTQMWKRALDAAGALEPPAQKASAAPETARALAALLRKHGLAAQAADMDRQAAALDAGGSDAGALSTEKASVG